MDKSEVHVSYPVREEVVNVQEGHVKHGKFTFKLDVTSIDSEPMKITSSGVNFDRSRQIKYQSSRRSTRGIGYSSFRSLGGQLSTDKSGNLMFNGNQVGRSTAPDFRLSIRPLTEIETTEIRELATSCLSPETGISSPSYILHQIVSLSIARSCKNYKVIFEDHELRKSDLIPDLTLFNEEKSYYLDVSGHSQSGKLRKYGQGGLEVVVVNKYLYSEIVLGADRYLDILVKSSLACDSRNSNFVEEAVYRHKPKGEILMDTKFLKFLLEESDETLASLSSDFRDSLTLLPYEKERAFKEIDLNRIPLPNIQKLDWLKPNWTRSEKMTSGRRHLWGVEIVGDSLDWQDGAGETLETSQYFDSSEGIFMDIKSYESILKINIDARLRAAQMEAHYYSSEMPKFAVPGAESYYAQDFTAKLKISKKMSNGKLENVPFSYTLKPNKVFRNLKKLILRSREVYPVRDIRDFSQRLEVSQKFIDPIDLEILKQSQKEKTIEFISNSSIYQILLLFRRVSNMLLTIRDLDGYCGRLSHPVYDLHANVYCSGAPLKTDSGVAYVTLESDNKVLKTWVWRASDIKAYSMASNRLISCCSGVEDRTPRYKRICNLYSLLILENSWGISKILKPYRYFATGVCYGSIQVDEQFAKFVESCQKEEMIWKNKASAVLLYYDLMGNFSKEKTGLTPAYGFNESNLGYEAFIVNLCSKETYGKRRHRVDMSTEIVDEIQMARKHEKGVRNHFSRFHTWVEVYKEIRGGKYAVRFCLDYLKDCQRNWLMTGGRFCMSPAGILMNYLSIKSIAGRPVLGYTPPLSTLLTTKASFDSINFKNASAVESITSLSTDLGLTTTSSIANVLLSRVVDLTYRMFDKDQVGGNREISILSSEFRIIQSITEALSKEYGRRTNIDMLDNPQKISLLAEAHNKCHDGVRFTVDQTRWGPNFATTLFGYMYSLFLRFTTEAWVPMMTCFIAECKIFQMLPYPELSAFQKTGFSLAGLEGPFHMGQGIFHYTSSLWHSLTQMTLGSVIESKLNLRQGLSLRMSFFVTSDDAAHFYSLASKSEVSQEEKDSTHKDVIRILKGYETLIIPFMIKTSNYKNMITWNSGRPGPIEFNSIFLNSRSVGSNSLKFLYSLLDPFTSGDRLRDMRRIWDVYSDGINSGLSHIESEIVCKLSLKYRLLQWGHTSRQIESLLGLLHYKKTQLAGEDIFILLSTRSDCESADLGFQCNNALPHRKYMNESLSLKKLEEISLIEKEIRELEIKRENLGKAKARRLGTDRGIVLSRFRRGMSTIVLPFKNRLGAITATSTGYLASVITKLSEADMINYQTCKVMPPAKLRKELDVGFKAVTYKKGERVRVNQYELLYSSYPRKNTFDPGKDGLLDIILHMSRGKHSLNLQIPESVRQLNFADRSRYFEEKIAQSRMTGNSVRLEFVSERREQKYYLYEDTFSDFSYMPSRELLTTDYDLRKGIPSSVSTTMVSFKNDSLVESTMIRRPKYIEVYSKDFSPTIEDFIRTGRALIQTDTQYDSLSSRSDQLYLSSELIVTKPVDEPIRLEVAGDEYEGMDLERILEEFGINLDGDFEEIGDDYSNLLAGKDTKLMYKKFYVKIKPHAAIITDAWFANEVKLGGIFYSLIRQGFLQSEEKVRRPELAWAVGTGYRKAIENLRFISLNNIKSIMRDSERQTRFPTSASEIEKVKQILNVSKSADNFDMSLVGRMPSGFQISIDRPEGDEVSSDLLISLLEKLENE